MEVVSKRLENTHWAWLSVGGRDGIVDVDENTGLVASVNTGNGNKWSGVTATAASDIDLATTNVELSCKKPQLGLK